MAAIARLVFRAAAGGRRVLAVSATMTTDVAGALRAAYRAGRKLHAATAGVANHVHLPRAGDAPGSLADNAAGVFFEQVFDRTRRRTALHVRAHSRARPASWRPATAGTRRSSRATRPAPSCTRGPRSGSTACACRRRSLDDHPGRHFTALVSPDPFDRVDAAALLDPPASALVTAEAGPSGPPPPDALLRYRRLGRDCGFERGGRRAEGAALAARRRDLRSEPAGGGFEGQRQGLAGGGGARAAGASEARRPPRGKFRARLARLRKTRRARPGSLYRPNLLVSS